jgi:hypothetical protein
MPSKRTLARIRKREREAAEVINRAGIKTIQREVDHVRRTRKAAGQRVPHKKTLQRIAEIAAEGQTPLEFLLAGYRYQDAIIQQELRKTRPNKKTILQAYQNGREFAVAAAPFCHPKLASITHKGDNNAPIRSVIEVQFVDPTNLQVTGILDDKGVYQIEGKANDKEGEAA